MDGLAREPERAAAAFELARCSLDRAALEQGLARRDLLMRELRAPADAMDAPSAGRRSDARRLHVLHVISGLGVGGAETMLRRLVLPTTGRGHSGRVRHTVVSLAGAGPIGTELRQCGIDVHALDLRGAAQAPVSLRRLRGLARALRPDVVQGWMYHGNLAAAAAMVGWTEAALAFNIRAGVLAREEKLVTRALVRIGAMAARRLNPVIVANSADARDAHIALGYPSSRFVVIPNGFDTDLFRPDPRACRKVRRELGIGVDVPLVGTIARAHPMKDYRNFVDAAVLVLARYPTAHFLAVGDGTDAPDGELMSRAREVGLAPRLHALGRRSDTARLLTGLDVFVLSSRAGESFPNVLGEASACGVPCVATAVGGVRELLGPGGAVVPPSDPEALAHAVGKLLRHSSEERHEIGAAARERIREHFGLANIIAAYEHLYDQMTPLYAD